MDVDLAEFGKAARLEGEFWRLTVRAQGPPREWHGEGTAGIRVAVVSMNGTDIEYAVALRSGTEFRKIVDDICRLDSRTTAVIGAQMVGTDREAELQVERMTVTEILDHPANEIRFGTYDHVIRSLMPLHGPVPYTMSRARSLWQKGQDDWSGFVACESLTSPEARAMWALRATESAVAWLRSRTVRRHLVSLRHVVDTGNWQNARQLFGEVRDDHSLMLFRRSAVLLVVEIASKIMADFDTWTPPFDRDAPWYLVPAVADAAKSLGVARSDVAAALFSDQ